MISPFDFPESDDHKVKWYPSNIKGCICGWTGARFPAKYWRLKWRNHITAKARPPDPLFLGLVSTRIGETDYWVNFESGIELTSNGWKMSSRPWRLISQYQRHTDTGSAPVKIESLDDSQERSIAVGIAVMIRKWSNAQTSTLSWGEDISIGTRVPPVAKPVDAAVVELIRRHRGTERPMKTLDALKEIDSAIAHLEVLKDFRADLISKSDFGLIIDGSE